MASVDILIVADPRFSGGTSSAIIDDVRAFSAMGVTVGILPVTSGFFDGASDRPNKDVLHLADLDGVTLLSVSNAVKAGVTFLHHPLTFFHGVAEKVDIQSERSLIVAHHPPFRGDGSMEYDPISTNQRVQKAFGLRPWWAPVSGVIRRHLRSFAPFIRQSSQDWVNVFDDAGWQSNRPAFSQTGNSKILPVVGRHSRSDPLKWPDARENILAPLNLGPPWRTRVMGCPVDKLAITQQDLTDWHVLDFNEQPVAQFLDDLDVFSYFYSRRWVEAFGRTIIEAMMMERPCVLDPRLRETFGDWATYCSPAEAPDVINNFLQNTEAAQKRAAIVRQEVLARYASSAIPKRLSSLQKDSGSISRAGEVQVGPLTTLRKRIGLARRTTRTISAKG